MRRIAIVLCLAALTALLAGCTGSHEKPCNTEDATSVVLVTSPCSNQPSTSSAYLTEIIQSVVNADGEISVVSAQGKPRVELGAQRIGSADSSTTSREIQNERIVAELTAQVKTLNATTEEIDFLGALSLAYRETASMEGPAKIIVCGNGLQTCGLIQFQRGLLEAEPEDVVAYYEAELPDLSGASIEWLYCGDTTAPQEELRASQMSNLRAIWKGLIEASGGSVVFLDENPEGSEPAAQRPSVSCVSVPSLEPMAVIDDHAQKSISLPNDEVFGFLPDTADLKDPIAAAEGIRDLVAKYPDILDASIVVTGHTASLPTSQDENLYQLGMKRAQAVKEVLVSEGVSPSCISCESRGSLDNLDANGNPNDLDENGLQIPELAQANRKVVVSFE